MSKTPTIATIILAAGMGKRMNNPNLPKVLVPLDSKPLLGYVIDVANELHSQRNIVIVGHKKELVESFVSSYNDPTLVCVTQAEQLGTGHATQQAESALKDFDENGLIIILSGDVPLIKSSTLRALLEFHLQNSFHLTLLSTTVEHPKGYGRIVRDDNGAFQRIVEEKDANETEKLIPEINAGIYCIEHKHLFSLLSIIKNSNAQGEYYLTDLVEIFKQNNLKVGALVHTDPIEISGVNTEEELKKLEAIYLERVND